MRQKNAGGRMGQEAVGGKTSTVIMKEILICGESGSTWQAKAHLQHLGLDWKLALLTNQPSYHTVVQLTNGIRTAARLLSNLLQTYTTIL